MSKKFYLVGGLIGLLILSILLVWLVLNSNRTNNVRKLSMSPSSDVTHSVNEVSTIESERTALAIFTQNPTLALSATPFYAEIIYNEVIRNLTEIPLPKRPCYLNPTNVPSNPSTPLTECGPLIATIALRDTALSLMDLMSEAGIQGTAGVDSTGLQALDGNENIPFIAVKSRIGFQIFVETVNNQTLLVNTISQLVDLLISNWDTLEYVAADADIFIQLTASDGSKSILTTYSVLSEAYKQGQRGESLIQSIGGFIE